MDVATPTSARAAATFSMVGNERLVGEVTVRGYGARVSCLVGDTKWIFRSDGSIKRQNQPENHELLGEHVVAVSLPHAPTDYSHRRLRMCTRIIHTYIKLLIDAYGC